MIECSCSPYLETLSFRVSELEHRNVLILKWNEDVIYVLIQSRLAQPTVREVASHENPSRQEWHSLPSNSLWSYRMNRKYEITVQILLVVCHLLACGLLGKLTSFHKQSVRDMHQRGMRCLISAYELEQKEIHTLQAQLPGYRGILVVKDGWPCHLKADHDLKWKGRKC